MPRKPETPAEAGATSDDTSTQNFTSASLTVPAIGADDDNLTAALKYADAGWYVAPVKRGTKHPGSILGKAWPRLTSRDTKVIAGWFAGTDHGIALHCGRSGAVVFDVDSPEKAAEWLVAALDDDQVPYQSSRPDQPRRGHLIYAMPADRTIGSPKIPGGAGEVRGLNGVIVVAPTVHKDGGEYRWLRVGAVPVLPDAVAAQLPAGKPGDDAATDAEVRRFLATYATGTTNDGWNGPLGRLHEKVTDAAHDSAVECVAWVADEACAGCYPAEPALAALKPVFISAVTSQRAGKDRRSLDAAESEWAGIVAWAVGQARAKTPRQITGIRQKFNANWDNNTVAEPTEPTLQDGDDEVSLLDKLSVTGDWLDAQHFAELEYIVPEMIPEGLGYIGAPPKKGKSFLVGNVAVAVASGGTALGQIPVAQRQVLYLALEDGHRRLQDRLRKMNAGQPIPAALTIVVRATPMEAMAVIAEYLERHGGDKPLVILDTLGKVKRAKRAGEDSYQADYAISGQLKALADSAPGCTVLVVHHTRKAISDDFVEALSGTYGIAGAADFVMVLARARGSDDAVLHITGRDVVEADYAMHADDGILWRLQGPDLAAARAAAENVARLGKLTDKHGKTAVDVWHYVNDDQRVVTPADVCAEFNLDRRRGSEILTRLANDGLLTKLARGEYGPG